VAQAEGYVMADVADMINELLYQTRFHSTPNLMMRAPAYVELKAMGKPILVPLQAAYDRTHAVVLKVLMNDIKE
jgi:hypothetical protein